MTSEIKLLHIGARELLLDSFRLGRKVYETGFRPRHAVSIWRGGTPVGLGLDAYFRMQGLFINHTSIATASYTGIDSRESVTVKGLEHLVKAVCAEDPLLIIDDVYESGNTIERIIELIRKGARANAPENIMVATLHHKPGRNLHPGRRVISLKSIDEDVWIDYPHELSDLYEAAEKSDDLIIKKDPTIHEIINGGPYEPEIITTEKPFKFLTSNELLYDSFKLGVNIFNDSEFFPDFIIALWPGGVVTGLPVHEVFKYMISKKGLEIKSPDHISINTSRHYQSYRANIIGMKYLEEKINKDHNVLVIDTTFRGGKLVNGVIENLKKTLKRNLSLNRIRVASVYYNPNDRSTWITNPIIQKPHYYLKQVDCEIIYPQNIHKLNAPRQTLNNLDPEMAEIFFS
ncbi:MAG: hypothetical protein CVV64_19985 [Candidatus Wallbacteria bacterium HGW-Wallbacteria-1]|jgi:hypothetical protein|uniref:Phosphoribosyltransferase domain-containing protein n=1 Tax=Candidatus Wallbacteria bacterium HGW-Wallbacteria-1 TaxID=2013854 RepID=A0A2N1PIL0_9BACT|nr:MAG: hypothetical protein CVV64_19985 [Candidatus Wallbacteria bacterium HGW-Wallbacteria-1]